MWEQPDWEMKPGYQDRLHMQHKLMTEKGKQLGILTLAPIHHLICHQG